MKKKIFINKVGNKSNTFCGELSRDRDKFVWETRIVEGFSVDKKPIIRNRVTRSIVLSDQEIRALVQAYISDPSNRISLK